jgi:hypothetical protein
VSAALFWVLRAYLVFYSLAGLFVVALIAVGVLGRLRSAVAGRWGDVPSRFSDASSGWSSNWADRGPTVVRPLAAPRLQPVPVRSHR